MAMGMKAAITAPIHECLVQEDMHKSGLGVVFVSRKLLNGQIAVSSFMLDIYCLGAKDSFFRIVNIHEYDELKDKYPYVLKPIHPTCAKKLIEGAVAYARQFEFKPDAGYYIAVNIFGDFDAHVCPENYEYGKNGKPLFISGPNDSERKIVEITNKLNKHAGKSQANIITVINPEEVGGIIGSDILDSDRYQALEYEVTSEPLPNKQLEGLPDEELSKINTLHDLALTGTQKAIDEVQVYIDKYPDVPQLYNYLYVAFSSAGEMEKGMDVIRTSINKFPDYLFAKLAYAKDCLEKGELDKIPEIFDGKYDISLLYPGRKKFHVLELLSFNFVLAVYFHRIGKKDAAKRYYKIMSSVDSSHMTTKAVKDELFPGFFKRMIRKITAQARSL